jgi:hypothetical protein
MRAVPNPELPPHKCFVCASTEDNEWVDCDHDFWPQGVTDRDGRIYLCGTCVEIAAGELGFVRNGDLEEMQSVVNSTVALIKTLAAEQEDQWDKVFQLAEFKAVTQTPRRLPDVVETKSTDSGSRDSTED